MSTGALEACVLCILEHDELVLSLLLAQVCGDGYILLTN